MTSREWDKLERRLAELERQFARVKRRHGIRDPFAKQRRELAALVARVRRWATSKPSRSP
jgi:hypothetical protein